MSRTVGLTVYWLLVAVPAVIGLWLGGRNLAIALIGGPVIATIALLVMRKKMPFGTLSGLDQAQRRQVGVAMQRGESVDSPELAAPLVKHSDAMLRLQSTPRFMRIAAVLMLAGGLLVSVQSIIADGSPRWSGVTLVVAGLFILFVAVPVTRRQRERIARAKQATEHRWAVEDR